jgi:uncharacterized protein YceK
MLRRALPLVALVALQGCFTAGVWGFELGSETDAVTGRESPTLEAQRDGEVVESLWFRLLATPFSLVLDCVTLPIQALLFGWDDEDDRSDSERDGDGWRSTHRDRND